MHFFLDFKPARLRARTLNLCRSARRS